MSLSASVVLSVATFQLRALLQADCKCHAHWQDLTETLTPNSFAFVEYEDRRDADDAYHEMHNVRLNRDEILKIEVSVLMAFTFDLLTLHQWARTPPSANWRFDGPARRGDAPRRDRSPRRRSASPPRRRGGYSPRKDERRERDYDRRDRDRSRTPDRQSKKESRDPEDERDRAREPENGANGEETKGDGQLLPVRTNTTKPLNQSPAPVESPPPAQTVDDLDTAE